MDDLEQYLSTAIRAEIETRYYARINAQSRLEYLVHDPDFQRDPARHVALWADHGVVHVRDVARQILKVLEAVHGVLIPPRSPARFEFMRAYAVLVTYVHDIGMVDFSRFGRAMHPEFVTRTLIGPESDDLFARLWVENGPVVRELAHLGETGALPYPAQKVLREMLAMANCHSKSKVPVEWLNDPDTLSQRMREAASTDLRLLFHRQRVDQARRALALAQQTNWNQIEIDRLTDALYGAEQTLAALPGAAGLTAPLSLQAEAFGWLTAPHVDAQNLTQDVVDTLRALRAADALRQRGTTLRTSGNYEIFVDRRTANAICALRLGEDKLFLLETANPLSAGEANIASSELGRDGTLRIAFHRGAFQEPGAADRAAHNAALVLNDIYADVVESFRRPSAAASRGPSRLLPSQEVRVLLEGTEDNPEFTEMVRQALHRLNPQLRQVECVPSLQSASVAEAERYVEGRDLDWDLARRRQLLERIETAGHKSAGIDLVQAFAHVKLVTVARGQVLIEPGTPAGFVYIPLKDGLKVLPLGGYPPFAVRAWAPLGNTGVIRGAPRNAAVVAEEEVELIMIPQETFLRHWHRPYTVDEFRQIVSGSAQGKP